MALKSKQLIKHLASYVRVADFVTGTGTGFNITAEITAALATAGDSGNGEENKPVAVQPYDATTNLTGLVVDAPYNKIEVYAAGTMKRIVDGAWNEVYGRLVKQGADYFIQLKSLVNGVETPVVITTPTTITFDFPYVFSLRRLPVFSMLDYSVPFDDPDYHELITTVTDPLFNRNLTINSVTQNLQADRVWSVGLQSAISHGNQLTQNNIILGNATSIDWTNNSLFAVTSQTLANLRSRLTIQSTGAVLSSNNLVSGVGGSVSVFNNEIVFNQTSGAYQFLNVAAGTTLDEIMLITSGGYVRKIPYSTFGPGTVTSIDTDIDGDALLINGVNDPAAITTSGTYSFGWQGTALQYVKGDGTLGTYSLAHNHYIADSSGSNQFSFGVDEAVRVYGTGGTTVSYNAGSKSIIINSVVSSGDIAHVHYVADAAGTTQFSYGINEAVRYEATGASTVSFDAVNKKVIISSTDLVGGGGGGGTGSLSATYTAVFNATTDWGSSWVDPDDGHLYYSKTFTHALGAVALSVYVWDSTTGKLVTVGLHDVIQEDPNNVTIVVTASPDERFAGRIVIFGWSLTGSWMRFGAPAEDFIATENRNFDIDGYNFYLGGASNSNIDLRTEDTLGNYFNLYMHAEDTGANDDYVALVGGGTTGGGFEGGMYIDKGGKVTLGLVNGGLYIYTPSIQTTAPYILGIDQGALGKVSKLTPANVVAAGGGITSIADLTAGTNITFNSGTTYNGSVARTINAQNIYTNNGSLTGDRTVTAGSYYLSITGANGGGTLRSSSSNGYAIHATGTSSATGVYIRTDSVGIDVVSSGSAAIIATGSSAGVEATGSAYGGVFKSTNLPLWAVNQASGSSNQMVLLLQRNSASGSSAGHGAYIKWDLNNGSNSGIQVAQESVIFTESTANNEKAKYQLKLINNTGTQVAVATVMEISSVGQHTWAGYSGTALTGSPTYILGTDGSGNVVKILASGVVSGGGGVTSESDPVALAKTITLTQGTHITITGTATQALSSNPSWTINATAYNLQDVTDIGNITTNAIYASNYYVRTGGTDWAALNKEHHAGNNVDGGSLTLVNMSNNSYRSKLLPVYTYTASRDHYLPDATGTIALQEWVNAQSFITGNQTITLSGDVTGSGATSISTTIASNAVTYAKFQDASAGNVVLGRAASSAGDYSEVAIGLSQLLGRGASGDLTAITLGTNLSMSGTTINATGGSAGHTIQEEGSGLTARANLNFIGSYLTAADDAGNNATTVTLSIPDATSSVTGLLTSTDWTTFNTAYTDRNKWDGGATGLTAATGRTSLGATTVGSNIFTAANPSAVRWIRVNADNTITFRTAAETATDLGALTSYTETDPLALKIASNLSDLNNAATARTNLGATTVGGNLFTVANPSAIRYIKINADNSVTLQSAASQLSDLGAQAQLNGTGFVKATGTTISYDNSTYLTGNQTITLSGDISGSGATSITTTIGSNKVTLAMMATVATSTVFYRKTAGAGNPEVQTLATLKTDLGLTGTNSGDQDLSGLMVKANNLSDVVSAATSRTNLGATTVGANIFTATNPSAVRWLRVNADNTVTFRTAAETATDIGALTSYTETDPLALKIASNLSDLNNAATARTNLGGTTVGKALFTVTDPSAVRYIKINADNSVTLQSAATQLSDLGGISGNQTITLSGNVTGSGTTAITTTIANSAVTYAKIQDVSATSRLLGRYSGGAGVVQEIIISTGLALDGSGNLTATGGGTLTPYAETPTGAVDGVNTDYVLSTTPTNPAGVIIVIGGVTYRYGIDYTISGATVTMEFAPTEGTVFAYYGVLSGGISGGDYLAKANNLSELVSVSTARTNLGATTVGANLFTATNPSAIRYIKINADNSVTFQDAATQLSSIGGAASGANTDITSVLLNQTGLVVKGATANALTIKPNETLTAGRILNIIVNDASRTVNISGDLTLAANFTTSGANALTLTTTGSTNVTLPTSGTLVTTSVSSLSSLATVGTITSGTLGTGAVLAGVTVTLGSDATGDMYYRNSSGVLTRIAAGAQNTVLKMGASSVPAWTSETGGWSELKVSGSNATTTGQSLVDITGLVTPTLSNGTLYEIEALLYVTTSTGTNGTQYGIAAGGTGGASEVYALVSGTAAAATQAHVTINASATATAAFLTAASISGIIRIKGFVLTRGAGTATISLQHLKVTSGTSTVRVGSVFRYKLA